MRKHTYEAYKDKIKVENVSIALFKDYKIRKWKMLQKIEHLRKRKHFSGSNTWWHKGIHLDLEVKTFFENSTPTMGFSMESSTQSLDFPLMIVKGIAGRGREIETYTQRVTKQSLSDYAQQDWPDMTKRSTSRHAKASSGKDSYAYNN
jgi:hypothetical protein